MSEAETSAVSGRPPVTSTPNPEPTWPALFTTLLAGTDLTTAQTSWAMDRVMSGAASPAQLAALLVALRAKGEAVPELRGLADTMLAHAIRWEPGTPALDIVGTGGDGAQTVNISTMACVVAAAAGVPVVKHGNRAASSASGSADVLEALGVRLDLDPASVQEVFADAGITFCFAQTFHPAFRHAAVVRRELAIPTAFNVLGPLTNPAQPQFAAVGVADPRMAPLIAGVFADRGRHAVVFRGDDGLDELSPATTSSLWWVSPGRVRTFTFDPAALGVPHHRVEDLRGADAGHNAEVARTLFAGAAGPVRDVVLMNTGLALGLVESTGMVLPSGTRTAPVTRETRDAEGTGEASSESTGPESIEDVYALVRSGMTRAAAAIDSGAAAETVARWAEQTVARVTR